MLTSYRLVFMQKCMRGNITLKYKIEQVIVLTSCADGFVQEWIHGKEKFSESLKLFISTLKIF